MSAIPDAVKQRFWAKVDKREPNDCWNWMASRFHCGYGQFQFHGRPHNAHRISYLFTTGVDPGGKWVLHSCDNRRCVNPAHLRLGNHRDNTDDMVARERQASGARHAAYLHPDKFGQRLGAWNQANPPKGGKNGHSRLTEADVIRILMDHRKYRDIARSYGVAEYTIKAIRCGMSWTHVERPRGYAPRKSKAATGSVKPA